MKDIQYITSENKPSTIVKLDNTTWYYNYNIQKCKINNPNFDIENKDDNTEIDGYKYAYFMMNVKPNYKDCVETIIRYMISASEEFDLVNSANKALINGITDSKDLDKYKEYLAKVEEIKNNVKKDF